MSPGWVKARGKLPRAYPGSPGLVEPPARVGHSTSQNEHGEKLPSRP